MANKNRTTELIIATRQYLAATLALHPELLDAPIPKNIKIGVKKRYYYTQTTLHGQKLLLCTPKENTEWTPKRIADDFITFSQAGHHPVLLVEEIAALIRSRLIEQKIDFIDPGKQLHLPTLFISLKEFGIKMMPKAHTISPSAQQLLLYLYQSQQHPHTHPVGITAWAHLFDYSRVTIHRAIQTLENFKAVKTSRKNKFLRLHLIDPSHQGFSNLLPHLKSPNTKTLYLAKLPATLSMLTTPAGYSALSAETDILDNPIPTVAISKSAYIENKLLIEECLTSIDTDAVFHLEVWSYPPIIPPGENTQEEAPFDRLSLYLSMKDISDERTESALEQLINKISWLKD